MGSQAPANFNQARERKYMSEDNSAIEDYKRNCEFHRLLRKYCGPNAYSVLTALQDRANDELNDGWAFPSYEKIMEDTGIGNRNAITTALELLFELGLIEWQLNGRQAIYKPVKKVNSTELILFIDRAQSYQIDTKDSIKTVPSIVSKRYSNVYQDNVNQDNELTTPKGVAAAPPKSSTIELVDTGSYQEDQPEQEPEPSKQQTYPAPLPSSTSKEVRGGLDAGVGGRDMNRTNEPEGIARKPLAKARDKPKTKGKEPDPNSKHPAVVIWQEIHERFPNKFQMPDIITKVGDDPGNLAEWRECLIYYAKHPSWDQTNSDKILDCFRNQNYKKGENFGQRGPHLAGNGATSTSTRTFQPVPKPFKPRGSRADGGFTLEEYAEDYSGT
jgi:hypothetical protein